MELINKEYIKIDKSDLFLEQVRASSNGNKFNLKFFQDLTRTIYDYEKKNHRTINELYIKTDSPCYKELSKTIQFTIKRQTIINAMIFAIMNNQTNIALQLKEYIKQNEIVPNQLGNLSDYVLINSKNINEVFNGEKDKFIYNDTKNEIEIGKTFDTNNMYNFKTNDNGSPTKFIENSYVIAAIMKINNKYFNKNYISRRQLNTLAWDIQKRFNEQNINALFVENIDKDYFEDYGDIIMLSDNYINNIESIEQRFQAYLPMEILSIIWDEKFILSNINENAENKISERIKNFTKNTGV